MAILKALEICFSKEQFIEKMKQFGWSVNFTDKRKHVTFQNQDGKKVRDSNLSKTFHLNINKEGLENEFVRNRQKLGDTIRNNTRENGFEGSYRQTESFLRESKAARRDSEIKRRNSATDNRTIQNAEVESIASVEQRRLEKHKWSDEQNRARETGKRNKRRSGPEL